MIDQQDGRNAELTDAQPVAEFDVAGDRRTDHPQVPRQYHHAGADGHEESTVHHDRHKLFTRRASPEQYARPDQQHTDERGQNRERQRDSDDKPGVDHADWWRRGPTAESGKALRTRAGGRCARLCWCHSGERSTTGSSIGCGWYGTNPPS